MSDNTTRGIALDGAPPADEITWQADAFAAAEPSEPEAATTPEEIITTETITVEPDIAMLAAATAQQTKQSMATMMVQLVTDSDAELWHDAATRDPYISVTIGDHREHYRLNSKASRDYLARLGHTELGRVPGGQALSDAVGVLAGGARYDGAAHQVAIRIARHGDNVVLDLADPTWRAVVISAEGYQIVDQSPVRFRRPRGMLPLPEPQAGGSLDELRALHRIQSERTWKQMAGWLVGAVNPRGPYPLLAMQGEAGTGKSTVARHGRGIIDPHVTALRGPVRDERDLMIAASHSHVVAFDNISRIPDWLQDGLCRIATGGGFATRQLFTDDEEHLITVTRPIMFTSVSAVITRGDLLDRSTVVVLPARPEAERRTEAEVEAEYEAMRPRLLGALLEAASAALACSPHVEPGTLPRMADHALWVSAAEERLGWPDGSYIQVYTRQQQEAVEVSLDGDPVVIALRQLMYARPKWEGTSTTLLGALEVAAPEATKQRGKTGWPRSPKGLSQRLDRLAPDLRRTGLDIRRYHTGKERIVEITSVGPDDSQTPDTDSGADALRKNASNRKANNATTGPNGSAPHSTAGEAGDVERF